LTVVNFPEFGMGVSPYEVQSTGEAANPTCVAAVCVDRRLRRGAGGHRGRTVASHPDVGRAHARFVGSMNFDPRADKHNTEIGLFIRSEQMAGQVLKLVDVLKQQGTYRLRLAADGQTLEWESEDPKAGTVLRQEPDTGFWAAADA
jgi:phosphatidylserine/phosphatidylglycerophosphate/cardiolipin synthase-like enzyme